MDDVVIRKMIPADIKEIVKNDLLIFGETLGEDIIREHLQNKQMMHYFVMEKKASKDLIGMMSLSIDLDKAQIINFYVLKQYLGLGYAQKLLDAILYYLKEKRVVDLTLEVRKSNTRAIRFYQKYRFKDVAMRKHYYANGEDALLMHLRIGSD